MENLLLLKKIFGFSIWLYILKGEIFPVSLVSVINIFCFIFLIFSNPTAFNFLASDLIKSPKINIFVPKVFSVFLYLSAFSLHSFLFWSFFHFTSRSSALWVQFLICSGSIPSCFPDIFARKSIFWNPDSICPLSLEFWPPFSLGLAPWPTPVWGKSQTSTCPCTPCFFIAWDFFSMAHFWSASYFLS